MYKDTHKTSWLTIFTKMGISSIIVFIAALIINIVVWNPDVMQDTFYIPISNWAKENIEEFTVSPSESDTLNDILRYTERLREQLSTEDSSVDLEKVRKYLDDVKQTFTPLERSTDEVTASFAKAILTGNEDDNVTFNYNIVSPKLLHSGVVFITSFLLVAGVVMTTSDGSTHKSRYATRDAV